MFAPCNFDVYKDFSVSYIDSGMGTYTLYRILVYDNTGDKFVEITPKCGDQFINVVLNTETLT